MLVRSWEFGVRSTARLLRTSNFELRTRRSHRGLSLIEVSIAAVLLSMFFSVVYETAITGLRQVQSGDEREDARRQVAQALDRIVREAGTATEMDVAETDRIQFDTAAVNNVLYQYSAAAQTLTRSDAASSAVIIARGLTAFDYDFIDCLGVVSTGTVATEDRVRVIQIVATLTSGTETVSLTNAAAMPGTIGDNAAYCGGL